MYREIRRRRNELVTEMYLLLKRKDDLGNILTVDENAEGLQAFVKETDIVERQVRCAPCWIYFLIV